MNNLSIELDDEACLEALEQVERTHPKIVEFPTPISSPTVFVDEIESMIPKKLEQHHDEESTFSISPKSSPEVRNSSLMIVPLVIYCLLLFIVNLTNFIESNPNTPLTDQNSICDVG